MDMIRSYRCPKKNGGCGKDDRWTIALREMPVPVLMCVCQNCEYRMNFPLSTSQIAAWTGPIDVTGKGIKKQP